MSVAVPPKIIRALTRLPPGAYPQIPSDRQLACWNFAVSGEDPNAPPIGEVYEYANGRGARPTLATFPNLLAGALLSLDNVRQTYTQYLQHFGAQYNGAKRTVLEQCSTRMLPVLCGLYGLPVSPAQTDIEIGLKFEAQLVRGQRTVWGGPTGRDILGRQAESDEELAERQSDLEIGYEHMWVRFKRVRTVETWVNLPTTHAAPTEQPPDPHKTVTRCYVTQLMPAHVAKLTALVTAQKGAPAFQHPAGPRPWVNDATVNSCAWCNQAFTYFTRRHHCRACGRIFCSDCAFRTEPVAQPAVQPGQAAPLPGAALRVCDTCYTGAN